MLAAYQLAGDTCPLCLRWVAAFGLTTYSCMEHGSNVLTCASCFWQAAIAEVRPSVYVDIASMGDSLPLPRAAAAALAADGTRPLIFALTQPGALSAQDAYEATDGRCIFADRELVRHPSGRRWPCR